MAFFKKDRKPNYVTEVKLLEKDYKNLPEALNGELSNGSLDAKETVIYFEDHKVTVVSIAGVIKSIYNEDDAVLLAERLYWTDELSSAEEDLVREADKNISDLISNYNELVTKYPQAKNTLQEVLYDYTLSVLHKTSSQFATHKKIRTEVITSKAMFDDIEKRDFFTGSIDSLREHAEAMEKTERLNLISLGISGFSEDEVSLSVLTEESQEFETDAKRFAFAAAQNESSLSRVRELSFGFVWPEVLTALHELSEDGIIKASFPGSDDALPLPDDFNTESEEYCEIENPFEDDDVLEDKNAVMDYADLPLVGTLVEPVNDPDEEYIFGSDVEEDDGSFMYEMMEQAPVNVATAGLDDNIERDIRKILERNAIPQRVKDEISSYAQKNSTLEGDLIRIEASLAEGRGRYKEHVNSFEELTLQNRIEGYTDDTETEHEKFEDIEKISNKQDVSHISFFTVSKLEEDRYIVNLERRRLLTKIAAMISELAGDNVQSILHRIEAKLIGIENVANVAFHSPKDDEDEIADPTLTTEQVFSSDDVPTFFALIEALGFDPFAKTEASNI